MHHIIIIEDDRALAEGLCRALGTDDISADAANELAVKKLTSEKDKVKTLVSDISHQTKTPIANLLLYAELLREERLPQSAEESVALTRSWACS